MLIAYCTLRCVHGLVCIMMSNSVIRCFHVSLIGAVLVAVLRSHGEASAAVAKQGLAAIRNLSCDAANNTRLGEAGACEGVWIVLACCVVVMILFIGFCAS